MGRRGTRHAGAARAHDPSSAAAEAVRWLADPATRSVVLATAITLALLYLLLFGLR